MEVPAVGTATAVFYAAGLYMLAFLPGAVAALKGHWLWLIVGAMLAPLAWWYIAVVRLAKPGSWWAERVYGPDKQLRAREEWGEIRAGAWTLPVGILMLAFPVAVGVVLALSG